MPVLCKPIYKRCKIYSHCNNPAHAAYTATMKTPKIQPILSTIVISVLALTGCATNKESSDGPTPAEAAVDQTVATAPDTARLQIPTLPSAPGATAPDAAITDQADAAKPSLVQAEAAAQATATEPLPADPLLAPPSTTAATAPAIDDNRPTAVSAIDSDTAPVAQVQTLVQAALDQSSAQDTYAPATVKKRLQQTDDISVITWRAERGHVDSQLLLGKAYATGNGVDLDLEQARLWLELASIQGDRQAQYELGKMYFTGTGVAKDLLNAREWWIESAISGDDRAQQKLGYLYSEGLGVERDFNQAKNWYLKAANLGNAEAQTLLGSLYHEGNRLPENYNEAIKWYRLAATQGHPHAQYALAILYHDGLGTEADPIKCSAWVDVAVANGYVDDLGAGKECRSKLEQQATIDANILADEWKKQFIPNEQSY